MTKLIIVRHGESLYNLTRQYTGQTDVPLTEKSILDKLCEKIRLCAVPAEELLDI